MSRLGGQRSWSRLNLCSVQRSRTGFRAFAGWQLHEEVAMAAFACGQHDVGGEVLKTLQKQFKESNRVECLRGMAYESIGNLDKAEEIYESVIASHPSHPDALKRKVCFGVLSPVPAGLPCQERWASPNASQKYVKMNKRLFVATTEAGNVVATCRPSLQLSIQR